jgi:hypothetical protein
MAVFLSEKYSILCQICCYLLISILVDDNYWLLITCQITFYLGVDKIQYQYQNTFTRNVQNKSHYVTDLRHRFNFVQQVINYREITEKVISY